MAYKVSFGDGDAEQSFFGHLAGYCLEIGDTDYGNTGDLRWDNDRGCQVLSVCRWDDEKGGAVGDPFDLPLTGDESIHVY